MCSAFAAARSKQSSWCRQVRRRRNRVNFHLTRSGSLSFFVRINRNRNTTFDMKKLLALSMLIPLAIVCSCQKQDAAAEQQLAQKKAELDAREKALDEREKALADKQKALGRLRTAFPPDLQTRAQTKDSSSNVQPSASIPPDLAPPDNTQQRTASRERRTEELQALRQRRMDAIQKMRSSMRARGNPSTGTPTDTGASTSGSGSADASMSGEVTSPSPSPTPQ
jgi:hypothetical protein